MRPPSARIKHLSDRTRKRLTLAACILGSSIVFVDGTAVNVALPAMQDDLGGGAVSLLGLLRIGTHVSYVADLLAPLLGFSLGLAMIVAPLTSTVLTDAGEHDAGIASGVNNAVARVAGLVGIAVVGVAVAGPDNKLDLSGFRLAMGITAALVAAGGVIGLVGIRNVGVG